MKPMLAGKFVEEKVVKQLPLFGQLKYDGIRVFIRDGIAYTRSLKPVRAETFQSWVAANSDFLEGMDGEIICGSPTAPDCYRRTMQFTMSYNKPDEFTFYVFDKWDEVTTFEERFGIVEYVAGQFVMSNILTTPSKPSPMKAAETLMLYTMKDVHAFHDTMIAQGQEGIILRRPDSYYKYGRGSPVQCECIKMKEGGWVDTECKIVGFHEQLHNANEATLDNLGHTERSGHKENLIGKDTLGAISVTGAFENGVEFECRVGTGLDDEIRQVVWLNQDLYRKKIVKMKYFTVGIKDKPRFPTFLGFRDADDMDMEQLDLFT